MSEQMLEKFDIDLADEAAMLMFGRRIGLELQPGSILFLYGQLGAGKTTLVRGILQGLGYQDRVKSPTYTIIEPYQINDLRIYHCDLYRIADPYELYALGIEEYFNANNINLIEWPEKGYGVLPKPDLACYLEIKDHGRHLHFNAHSAIAKTILDKINDLR
jgi:tRNA threonylcarbamoyladenosine biosynthesis protein TsaE